MFQNILVVVGLLGVALVASALHSPLTFGYVMLTLSLVTVFACLCTTLHLVLREIQDRRKGRRVRGSWHWLP